MVLTFIRNIFIVVFISVSILFALEMILRISYPDQIIDRPNPKNFAYRFNEDYLISLTPNIEKTFVRHKENGGERILWKTNKDSFRNPPLETNPNMRIIVYGDSNVQARFSKEDNTFVHRLGDHLRTKGLRDVEVINAGVVGFGPDQSLIRFEKEADTYKPDLVIFHITTSNDFGDIVRNRLFELDENDNLKKTSHTSTVDEGIQINTSLTLSDFLSSLLISKQFG